MAGDPATALRVIEQQRKRVVESGGPLAATEAEELAKLHEWQMNALGRSRRLAVTAWLAAGDSHGNEAAMSEGSVALGILEATVKHVVSAASSPDLCLLRGRLLLSTGHASDAIAPLGAAVTLLAPSAIWRSGISRILAVSSTGATSAPGTDERYLAAEMYLGLAQAADGGIKKYDDFAPRLRLAIDAVERQVPPPTAEEEFAGGVVDAAGDAAAPRLACATSPYVGTVGTSEGLASRSGDGHECPGEGRREQMPASAADQTGAAPAGGDDDCAICLQALRPGERVQKLPCNHAFHCVPCLQRWFRRSRLCPVCRQPFPSPVGRPLVRCLLSPVNPDVLQACRRLAAAQAERGLVDAACATCALAERIYIASLAYLGGRSGASDGVLGDQTTSLLDGSALDEGAPAIALVLQRIQIHLVWARALVRCGREPEALRLCTCAARLLHSGARGSDELLCQLLSGGGLLVDSQATVRGRLLGPHARAPSARPITRRAPRPNAMHHSAWFCPLASHAAVSRDVRLGHLTPPAQTALPRS